MKGILTEVVFQDVRDGLWPPVLLSNYRVPTLPLWKSIQSVVDRNDIMSQGQA